MMEASEKLNLLSMDRAQMEAFFSEMGEKAFRATQVMKWIYQQGIDDFDDMSNLSKTLREKLKERCEIRLPRVSADMPSSDGTRKWAIELQDGNHVEMVLIPESGRTTLCVSSQVGCTLACSFCSTARQGFNRNLTTDEMIGQLVLAARLIGLPENKGERVITNVVLMGMGEPLLNLDNVIPAMELMQDDLAFGISKRRITLSTAGIVPGIEKLTEVADVSLAVSLHACNDKLRDELVPINKKYPIAQLLKACKGYIDGKLHRRITFEYVMLKGINDSLEDARTLARLLKNIPSKVNLIPFNPFPGTDYRCSSQKAIHAFGDVLHNAGITTITRKTRGEDIDAACGQLVGRVQDKTRRSSRYVVNADEVKVL